MPILVRAAVFTVVVVGAVALGGMFFREPLEAFANWVVTELGLLGVFVGVFLSDAFTVPIPPDTYLFVAVASEDPVAPILAACCLASVVAGSVAYVIGPWVGRLPLLAPRLEHFRARGEQLFLRYGVWTVALAALTPIPFSITCWLAGIYKMPYRPFFIATFARIPRLVGYFALYALGWAPPVGAV